VEGGAERRRWLPHGGGVDGVDEPGGRQAPPLRARRLKDGRKIPGRFQPLRASLVGPCLPSAASSRVVSPTFDGRRPWSTSSRCRRALRGPERHESYRIFFRLSTGRHPRRRGAPGRGSSLVTEEALLARPPGSPSRACGAPGMTGWTGALAQGSSLSLPEGKGRARRRLGAVQAWAGCFSVTPFWVRCDCSSPDWNISRTMSQPPRNSPLT
jgi:hypothetical protein